MYLRHLMNARIASLPHHLQYLLFHRHSRHCHSPRIHSSEIRTNCVIITSRTHTTETKTNLASKMIELIEKHIVRVKLEIKIRIRWRIEKQENQEGYLLIIIHKLTHDQTILILITTIAMRSINRGTFKIPRRQRPRRKQRRWHVI